MADKNFGIKQLELIGAGDPTIQSTTTLNLTAPTTSISNNVTIGGNLSVTGSGAGKVLQLIRVVHTSQAATTSGSSAWVSTGLQASITPSSTNSKILVSFEHSIYHSLTSVTETSALHAIRIKRGSTVVYNPPSNNYPAGGVSGPYEFGLQDTDTTKATTFYNRSRVEYLDSPSTTSSITYSTELAAYNGSGVVYSNYQDQYTTTTPQSWITLMEIGA